MTPEADWTEPARLPALAPDEVHVWRACLSASGDSRTYADFQWVLDPDERARAERFRADRDRHRFAFRRAVMKCLLARYLQCEPGAVRVDRGPFGKPALAAPFDRTELRFNLSHSNGMVLLAVTQGRDVGVDVEHIRPDVEIDQVARMLCSDHEASALAALSADDRLTAFFACWTRKEAFVKATGHGLSRPLKSFEVSLASPAALISTRDDPAEAARWSMADVRPGGDYRGALAAEGQGWRVVCWDAGDASRWLR